MGTVALCERSNPLGPHLNLKQHLTLACISRAKQNQPLKGPGFRNKGKKKVAAGVQCLAVCEAAVHGAGLGGRGDSRSTGPGAQEPHTFPVFSRCHEDSVWKVSPTSQVREAKGCKGPRLMQGVVPRVGAGPQPCSEYLLGWPVSVLEVTALPLRPSICPGPPCFPSPNLWENKRNPKKFEFPLSPVSFQIETAAHR